MLGQITQARAGSHRSPSQLIFAQGTQAGWEHKAENGGWEPGQELRCAMGTQQRWKKSSRISEGMSFRSQTSHVSSFLVKEKQRILFWFGPKNKKKKAVSKLFQFNCFLMKQLLWNYTLKKLHFENIKVKCFDFLKPGGNLLFWQEVVIETSMRWDMNCYFVFLMAKIFLPFSLRGGTYCFVRTLSAGFHKTSYRFLNRRRIFSSQHPHNFSIPRAMYWWQVLFLHTQEIG